MRDAGVQRVALLSSSAVPLGDTTNAVARYHIESEAAVKESGLGWTMLQPNGFMTNALQWVAAARRPATSCERRSPACARRRSTRRTSAPWPRRR